MQLDELVVLVDALVADKTHKHLRDIDIAVLKGAWHGKKYEDIAEANNYTPQYIKRDVGPKLWKLLTQVLAEKVSKKNVRTTLDRWSATHWEQTHTALPTTETLPEPPTFFDPNALVFPSVHRDWGESEDIDYFVGRDPELKTLSRWCQKEACRLVAVLGMGGMGKTALALRLAQTIQSSYEFVIWRSLKTAPTFESLVLELISFLSSGNETELPKALPDQISRLISYLQNHRCLLILDGFESILAPGKKVGQYQEGYGGYQELVKAVGDRPHQSTLLLTSREKPKEIAVAEGVDLAVRSEVIKGLEAINVNDLLIFRECYGLSELQCKSLAHYYGGNPLLLNAVASAMPDFNQENHENEKPFVFREQRHLRQIEDLFTPQFERLSRVERHVLYWLAINREPMMVYDLTQDIASDTMRRLVPEAVRSLSRRSFLEQSQMKVTLQPVLMEYISARLAAEIGDELCRGVTQKLQTFALVKVMSPDYVQDAQYRYLLEPIQETLEQQFPKAQEVQSHLRQLLHELHQSSPGQMGYGAGNLLNLMRSLEFDLTALDLSGLVVWQADLDGVNLTGVNLSDAEVSKSRFSRVTNATLSLAFSPDGQLLATGHGNNQIYIRSVDNFKEVQTATGHTNWVSCLAFSPDSKLLASGSFDHALRLWNVETGRCLFELRGHHAWIWAVAFSPDGQMLASAGNDGKIYLWNMAQGDLIRSWKASRSWIWSLAFSESGTELLSGGDDACIHLWDVTTGHCLQSWAGHESPVSQVAFTPDQNWIVSASFDRTVKIWPRNANDCSLTLEEHDHSVLTLAVCPDPKKPILATAGQDFAVRIWNYHTGELLRTLPKHPSGVWTVAFHPDGDRLASCSNDGMLKLWDVAEGRSLRTIRGYSSGIKSLAVSPTGNQVVTGGDDEVVKLWNVSTGEVEHRFVGHTRWVHGVTFSPSGKDIASCSNDATVRVWDVLTGEMIQVLEGHTNVVYSLAYHPDGQQLASGGDDQTVRVWDLQKGEEAIVLPHDGRIWSVSYSPDGQTLAVGCHDHDVYLWDVANQTCVRRLAGHKNLVACVEFSPDGAVLASASDDRTIRLWDVQTGECLKILKGHSATVWSLAFSPDGRLVASGSFDQTVRFWDWQAEKCLQSMIGAGGEIWSVAFNPCHESSLRLWSGNQQGALGQWNCETGQLLSNYFDQRPYEQLMIQNIQGLTEAQIQSLKLLGAID